MQRKIEELKLEKEQLRQELEKKMLEDEILHLKKRLAGFPIESNFQFSCMRPMSHTHNIGEILGIQDFIINE
jgi:hypothetical protein